MGNVPFQLGKFPGFCYEGRRREWLLGGNWEGPAIVIFGDPVVS